MDKFNELLAKYDKTVEDVTFDYENMTDEELESAFASAFETAVDSGDSSSEENDDTTKEETKDFADGDAADAGDETGGETAESDPTDPTEDQSGEETTEDEHQSTSAIEDEDSTGTRVENSLEYSATFNGQTRSSFATLNEQLEALWTLVNDMYGEADNEWYSVDADPDKKVVYMHGWNNHYRQSYKVKNDVYSLTGDRTKIYPVWLSDDERKELDKMKSNYSSIEAELDFYKSKELHSAREEVVNSECYSVMAEYDEFKNLKDHMDDYSVEELTKQADLVYAQFMKSSYGTFASNQPKKKTSVLFMTTGSNEEETKLPYGGLFKNFKKK